MELWRRLYVYTAIALLVIATLEIPRKQKFDNVLTLDNAA